MENKSNIIRESIYFKSTIENLVDDEVYKYVMLKLWYVIWDRTRTQMVNNITIDIINRTFARNEYEK